MSANACDKASPDSRWGKWSLPFNGRQGHTAKGMGTELWPFLQTAMAGKEGLVDFIIRTKELEENYKRQIPDVVRKAWRVMWSSTGALMGKNTEERNKKGIYIFFSGRIYIKLIRQKEESI